MTNRDVSLYLVTWNVADKGPPPDDLTEFLHQNSDERPEVVAVGLQEAKKEEDWFEAIRNILLPRNYVLVKRRSLWAIHLCVFVQRKHLGAVHNIESEATRSGYGGIMGNKGGVSIRMDLYGVNFIIVNAHFTAHLSENHERIEDFMDIIDNQRFKDPDVEKLLDHDFVFWMGDLNFRLSDVDHDLVCRKIEQGKFAELLKHDQLRASKDAGMIFSKFEEGQINFAPTYKFDKGTDIYDTSSKHRKPAWTDRVLHMINSDNFENLRLDIQQKMYGSLPQYKASDHKPVYALYNLKVFPKPPPMPVVMETPSEEIRYNVRKGAKLRFAYRVNHHCRQRFAPSGWDWVGLYRHDFPDFETSETHAYVPSADLEDTDYGVEAYMELPKGVETDIYQLIYFSKTKNCPVGYSRPFRLHVAPPRMPVTVEAEAAKCGTVSVEYIVHHSSGSSFPVSSGDRLVLMEEQDGDAGDCAEGDAQQQHQQQQTKVGQVASLPVPDTDRERTGFGVSATFGGVRPGSYRVGYLSEERGALVGASGRFLVSTLPGTEEAPVAEH